MNWNVNLKMFLQFDILLFRRELHHHLLKLHLLLLQKLVQTLQLLQSGGRVTEQWDTSLTRQQNIQQQCTIRTEGN